MIFMATKKAEKKEFLAKKSSSDKGRVATGIKNFDSLIEGGFEKNSTNEKSNTFSDPDFI